MLFYNAPGLWKNKWKKYVKTFRSSEKSFFGYLGYLYETWGFAWAKKDEFITISQVIRISSAKKLIWFLEMAITVVFFEK